MKSKRQSAGILLYRITDGVVEVFLVHPGGPFWKGKDAGAWTIPKGEFTEDEEPLTAAKREFREETGTDLVGTFIKLTPVLQKGGKLVHAWAVEGTIDAAAIKSNVYEMEWPPKSGIRKSFPEVDKGEWFSMNEATQKINPAQVQFINEIMGKLFL